MLWRNPRLWKHVFGAHEAPRLLAALALAAAGAKVVVNDIGASTTGEGTDAGPAQKVVEEIRAAGGQAVANMDSMAEAAAAGCIVQCALDQFGRIDGVVNNAGILRDRFFHKMSLDEWDAVPKVQACAGRPAARAPQPLQGGRCQWPGKVRSMASTAWPAGQDRRGLRENPLQAGLNPGFCKSRFTPRPPGCTIAPVADDSPIGVRPSRLGACPRSFHALPPLNPDTQETFP